MRILIVDDDPDVRLILGVALQKIGGHRVELAASAEEALAWLEGEIPDALVADVQLPGMSGRDLIRTVRTKPALSALPVVFLTGETGESEIRALLELGARGVVAKPFDPERISGELERLFGEPASR